MLSQVPLSSKDRLAVLASGLQEYGAQTLNPEQRCAVVAVLCSNGTAMYALNGPPGTGKTVRRLVPASRATESLLQQLVA